MSHDAAVAFFAGASPEDVADILRQLLRTDEHRVISILADLNRRTAETLIQPVINDFPWLADLPQAAEGIASCAAASKFSEDQRPMRLEHVTTGPECKHSFVQTCESDSIYWNDGIVCVVSGEIARCYASEGGFSGHLGFPLADEIALTRSQHGTKGTMQDFEKGVVCSSGIGTYAVPDRFNKTYQSVGGPKGWLGFPSSVNQPYDSAKTQRFEGGKIYSSTYGTYPVRDAVAECVKGWLPITMEIDAGRSSVSGQVGRVQRFQGIPGGRISVYSSDKTGIHVVGWGILKYYQAEGGPTSKLGFPISGHTIVKEQGYIQMFEGGCVYARSISAAVTVPTSTADKLKRDSEVAAQLGWPVSEEKAIEKSGARVQFFENGIVTRQGSSEIWLRR